MSVSSELSSDVAIAFFTNKDVEKTSNLLGVMFKFQDTLRALSKEERRRRHARLFNGEPPREITPSGGQTHPGN